MVRVILVWIMLKEKQKKMSKDNQYIKAFAIRNASKFYRFKETEHHEGYSYALGCRFYTTKYDQVYITDYDSENAEDLEKRDLSMLIYINHLFVKTKIISNELLKSKKSFNSVLNSFKQECSNICSRNR